MRSRSEKGLLKFVAQFFKELLLSSDKAVVAYSNLVLAKLAVKFSTEFTNEKFLDDAEMFYGNALFLSEFIVPFKAEIFEGLSKLFFIKKNSLYSLFWATRSENSFHQDLYRIELSSDSFAKKLSNIILRPKQNEPDHTINTTRADTKLLSNCLETFQKEIHTTSFKKIVLILAIFYNSIILMKSIFVLI